MAEIDEIIQTIERLESALDDLAVRGLRSAGPQDLAGLDALREEFERIGASHLAERVAAVTTAIRNDDRKAAAALLHARASLRVFERVLTLEVAAGVLGGMVATGDGEGDA
jgi:hypothetical protein